MKIKLNTNLGTYKKDTVLDIKADKNNIPLDKYWRQRLKDAATDNCVELVKEVEPTKKRVK